MYIIKKNTYFFYKNMYIFLQKYVHFFKGEP